jgi:hypothetical protein
MIIRNYECAPACRRAEKTQENNQKVTGGSVQDDKIAELAIYVIQRPNSKEVLKLNPVAQFNRLPIRIMVGIRQRKNYCSKG